MEKKEEPSKTSKKKTKEANLQLEEPKKIEKSLEKTQPFAPTTVESSEKKIAPKKIEKPQIQESNATTEASSETKEALKKPEDETKDEPKKSKKKKKILQINITKCRSELKLLRHLIQKNGWKVCQDLSGHLLWNGLDYKEDDISDPLYTRVNRFPGMKELAHKNTTGQILNKFQEYFPESFDFHPKTFLLPSENEQFKEQFAENKNKTFIAKPTAGSQGEGILLIQSKLNNTPFSQQYANKELIVQSYIDNPLIIDKKKFDMRIQVLITNLNPLIAFVNDEGLGRFCTEDYEYPTQKNITNGFMHLTNYSLNKMSPKFVQTEELTEINDGSKRTLTSLWKSIAKAGQDVNEIKANIYELIISFLKSIHPFILQCQNTAFEGKNIGKCFHILGFDILLDNEKKPWLLEINANPSLNIDFEAHLPNGEYVTNLSKLDLQVKEKVVEDSIFIVTKSIEKQMAIGIDNNFNSQRLILCEEVDSGEMKIFQNMLAIYGKLSGYKFRGSITASQFAKLAAYKGMLTEKVTKPDYDLIFKKAMMSQFDQTHMDFYGFILAIEMLAMKLKPVMYEEDKCSTVTSLVDDLIVEMKL